MGWDGMGGATPALRKLASEGSMNERERTTNGTEEGRGYGN